MSNTKGSDGHGAGVVALEPDLIRPITLAARALPARHKVELPQSRADSDPKPHSVRPGNAEFESIVRRQLALLGEDPHREGLRRTPQRVATSLTWLTRGYDMNQTEVIGEAVFEETHSSMVMVLDIELYSLCEHHLLPFFGTAAVAYIPRGKVIGLSKIPRIVEMYARRLQVQERMTQQIADFLNDRLGPQGVGVVVEANHLCAVMRGIRKPGTVMTTSSVLGLFRTRDRTRAEFLSHLERRPPER